MLSQLPASPRITNPLPINNPRPKAINNQPSPLALKLIQPVLIPLNLPHSLSVIKIPLSPPRLKESNLL